MPRIEVPIGDIFDKMSILEIKSIKTNDTEKLKNITKELSYIKTEVKKIPIPNNHEFQILYSKLKDTNHKLWDIEDNIRIKEQKNEFDHDFIHLARSVYTTNDQRADLKKSINILLQSDFIEEKIYND